MKNDSIIDHLKIRHTSLQSDIWKIMHAYLNQIHLNVSFVIWTWRKKDRWRATSHQVLSVNYTRIVQYLDRYWKYSLWNPFPDQSLVPSVHGAFVQRVVWRHWWWLFRSSGLSDNLTLNDTTHIKDDSRIKDEVREHIFSNDGRHKHVQITAYDNSRSLFFCSKELDERIMIEISVGIFVKLSSKKSFERCRSLRYPLPTILLRRIQCPSTSV